MNEARSNFLAAAPLDRLGHLRSDASWLASARQRGLYVAVWRRRLLVTQGEGEAAAPVLLPAQAIVGLGDAHQALFLGSLADTPCFAFVLDGAEAPPLPGEFEDIRSIGHRLRPEDAALLAYARAMVVWHERHRYCSSCGAPTATAEAGHARQCSACGAKHFPRVDPAIIVLVADDERCLLGRQPSWPPGRYSTVAGFVEPGESLEDAVRREVREETGILVDDVRYHSSQPWPFPASLMLGFSARVAGGTIALHDGELEDARWVTRDQIRDGQLLLPPRVSIAYRLIEQWYDAAPGRRLSSEAEPGPWIARPEP
jgi:NAD+ diphosphatase